MDIAARSRWTRRLVWAGGALALYALIGFLLVPWWARGWLEERVSTEYARPLTIARLAFNPFTFRARAENVAVGDGRGGTQLAVARIEADYELRSFFSRARHVAELILDQPRLTLRRGGDGAFDLPHALTPPPLGPQPPLLLRLGKLVVIDGDLRYADAAFGDTSVHLRDIDLDADELDTQGEAEPGRFGVIVREGGGATFNLRGRVHPGKESVTAEIVLTGLGTELLRPFLAGVVPAQVAEIGMTLRAHYARDAARPDGVFDAIAVEIAPLALAPADGGEPLLRLDRIALEGGSVDLGARTVAVESVAVSGGRIVATRTADGSVPLRQLFATATASTDAAPTPTPDPAPGSGSAWRWQLARVEVAGVALALRDDGVVPAAELALALERVVLAPVSGEPDTSSALEAKLGIGEDGTLAATGELVLDRGSATLELDAGAIALEPAQPYLAQVAKLTLRGGSLSMAGQLVLAPADEPRVRYTGSAAVQNFATVDARRQRDFLNWKSLDLQGIDLALSPDRVRVEKVLADGMYARVIVAADRSTNIGDIVIAGDDGAGTTTDVAIARLELKRSRLRFADLSLTPRFQTTIEALGGTITGLSSKPGARARVDLAGQVDAYAPATVTGELNPFRGAENTDIALAFRNVELNSLTPYSGKFAGYRIDRGKLNLDLRYVVADGQLDGKNRIVLDQLSLGEKVDSPDAVSLPLTLAIALLKDGNGVIDLDIPVYGDLNDPKFRLGGVIWKAVLSLLTKIVTAPFALIGALVGGGPDDDSLSRIAFDLGVAAPRATEVAKFEKLRRALLARPQLTLAVRGVADPLADGRALAEAALRAELTARWSALRGESDPELPPPETERELLLALHAERAGPPPSAPTPTPVEDDAAAPDPAEQEAAVAEWLLGVREAVRDSYEAGEPALDALANSRAAAVRDGLLASGELPPEQVFLARSELAATWTDRDAINLPLELGAR